MITGRTSIRIALGLVTLAALGGAGAFTWWRDSGLPQRSGAATIAELDARVEVRFDEWGVPHVGARSLVDLGRALGWLHANDRFGQMELQRRLAAGRLAELVGERAVSRDRKMRRLQIARTAERVLDTLAPRNRALLEAYAEGVNAWLDSRGGDLPPELVLLRDEPERWQARDSVSIALLMGHMLSYSYSRDLARWQWLVELGEQRTRELIGVEGLEIAPEILALAPEFARQPAVASEAEPRNGSNNWSVDATRSASGHALLANDPHLGLGLPSIWYQALLRSPEYDAAGFTLPGLPIVVVGQGAKLAWGFTNSELDVCDAFFEHVSSDGRSVERDGAWVALRVERETIHVRDGADVELRIETSDIGPFFEAAGRIPAHSLAWTAYAAFDPIEAFLGLARASGIDDVPAAVDGYVGPPQNLVCGDAEGAIGFVVLGRAVERGFGDGRLPLPAWKSQYRWRDLQPSAHTPRSLRPAAGVLATANNDTRGEGFAFDYTLDAAAPHRQRRIESELLARRDWDVEGLASIQTDVTSLYALEVVGAIGELDPGASDTARRALEALRDWDGRMTQRGTSALYALVEHALHRNLLDDELRAVGLSGLAHPEQDRALLDLLEGRLSAEWFDDARTPEHESRAVTLARILESAWNDGARRWGDAVASWDYGEIHRWTPRHPLGDAPLLGRFFDRESHELPGSDTSPCVFSGDWNGDHIEVGHGASLRFVADAADPDASMVVIPGGQAGQPFDPHYSDQIELYVAGRSRPLCWSEASILEHTHSLLELVPYQR